MLVLKYLQLKSKFSWSLSTLAALLRQQLFFYRDLWVWLDDRALRDEQSGNIDRFAQEAAAVVAQIEHHSLHAGGLQLRDQGGDVLRGAALFGGRLGVIRRSVEFRERDDANGHRLPVGPGHLEEGRMGAGRVEFDDVARDH